VQAEDMAHLGDYQILLATTPEKSPVTLANLGQETEARLSYKEEVDKFGFCRIRKSLNIPISRRKNILT
jgi:hypothetical protein